MIWYRHWVEMRLGVLVFAGLCMWMGVSIIRSGAASGRSLERLEPRGPRHDTWELMTLQH